MTIKLLIVNLFLSAFGGAYAQESINLIFKYNGFIDDPYKLSFIASNISSKSEEEEIAELSEYYVQNEKEILYSFDCNTFLQYINEIAKAKEERKQQIAAGWNMLMDATVAGVSAAKQRKAEINNQKALQKAEQQAQMDRLKAQNKQKAAAFREMQNSSYHSSNKQQAYNTQSGYNDLLTSDPNWNKQIQMSVQQYGIEKTRQKIKEGKITKNQINTAAGGYNGKVISAVTESRQAIKIQLRGNNIGDRVVAYSLKAKVGGQQDWIATDGIISKCTSTLEFSYETSIRIGQNSVRVYFDM